MPIILVNLLSKVSLAAGLLWFGSWCVVEPAWGGDIPVNCGNLPSVFTFISSGFPEASVRKVQECLKEKDTFAGPVDGKKSPLTVAALKRAHDRANDNKGTPSGAPAAASRKKAAPKIAARKGGAERVSAKQQGLFCQDCGSLPTRQLFLESRYGRDRIRSIQRCLIERGYYSGQSDGIGGPLTLEALDRYHGETPTVALGRGESISYRLTGQDLEELAMAGDMVKKLQELRDTVFESKLEMVQALKECIKEVTDSYDRYDTYLPKVLQSAGIAKKLSLGPEFYSGLKKEQIPEDVITQLQELQDQKFKDKDGLEAALKARLRKACDPSGFYEEQVIQIARTSSGFELKEPFFQGVGMLRVPEIVLEKVQGLKNIEYPNQHLFENALDELVLKQLVKNGDINGKEAATSKEILADIAGKEHAFDHSRNIRWKGTTGCHINDDFSGVIYAIYPFWKAGEAENIDFSAITRVGYFSVGFNGDGELTELKDWERDRSAFINKARQYETAVDLVIYRSDWSKWPEFVMVKRPAFIKKLAGNIAAAVNKKLDLGFINRFKPYISLGRSTVPTMGNGVTIYFEEYPQDAASEDFLVSFIKELRTQVDAVGSYKLNLVLPMKSLSRTKSLYQDVDLFLVLIEEPTTLTKKQVRDQIEGMFEGETRRDVLRKIIPVISAKPTAIYRHNPQQQFYDLVYYQDNFGGVGLWTLPSLNEPGAADLLKTITGVFRNKRNGDILQGKIIKYAPWLTDFVGPHRWAFRVAFDLLLVMLVLYGLLAVWIYELRAFYRRRINWFFAAAATVLILKICLLIGDPYQRGKTTVSLLAYMMALIPVFIAGYASKSRRKDYP